MLLQYVKQSRVKTTFDDHVLRLVNIIIMQVISMAKYVIMYS